MLDRKRTALCVLGGLTLVVVCGIALVALLNAAFSIGESIWPGPAPQPPTVIHRGAEPIYSDGDGNIVEMPTMCAWYGSDCCLRNPGAWGCGRQVPTVAPAATPAPAPTTDAILTELLDAVDFDWGMCFGDCCITAEAFEEFTRKQCEGGG